MTVFIDARESRTARLTARRTRGTLIEIHDEWQIAERRYVSDSSMALIDNNTDQEVATHELIAS